MPGWRLFYNFYPRAACTVSTCRLFEGYVSSTDGGARWSAPQVIAGPMRLRQLPSAGGFMVGDYEGTAVVPGGDAFSAFAVGGIPAAGQRFNQAMYEPSGGAPVTRRTAGSQPGGCPHLRTSPAAGNHPVRRSWPPRPRARRASGLPVPAGPETSMRPAEADPVPPVSCKHETQRPGAAGMA